jgi:parallel beta-helix repeat protein
MATVTITGNTIRGATASKDNRTWQIRAVAYQYGGTGGGVITPGADWETLYPVDGVLTFTAEAGSVVDIKTPEGVPYRVRIPTSNAGLWDTIEAGVAYQPDVAQDLLNRAVANAAPGFIAAELGLQTADAITTDLDARAIGFVDDGGGEGHFTITDPDGAVVSISGTLVPPSSAWSSLAGKPYFSARDFGATGNGTTDDTANIHAARDAAGVGGKVFFPVGTYLVDGLTASVANQTWELAAGAVLKMAVGAASVLAVTAQGVSVIGGTFDGSNGTAHDWSQQGIAVSADGFTIRDATINDSPKHGVYALNSEQVTISGCTVNNSYDTGFFIQNNAAATSNVADIVITGNLVDNASAGNYSAGIMVRGEAANRSVSHINISNNTIKLPYNQSQQTGAVGVIHGSDWTADSNVIIGGWSGITCPGSTRAAMSNNLIKGFYGIGIEIAAGADGVVITGNVIDADSADAGYGIQASAGTVEGLTVSGNVIRGFPAGISYAVNFSSGAPVVGATISGNTITSAVASGVFQGLYFADDATNVTITGNVIDAASTANSYGMTFYGDTTGVSITGNQFSNIAATVVNMSTGGGGTFTDIKFLGNLVRNCALTLGGGGATGGTRIVSDDIPPLKSTDTAAGTTYLDVNSAEVQLFTGTGSISCYLPTTTIPIGRRLTIINKSTGTITVRASGAATVATLTTDTSGIFIATRSTPTTDAHWAKIT